MSGSEAKVVVAQKTLEGFFNRVANTNESLGIVETRMDDLLGRLKGLPCGGAAESDAAQPAGVLPRISEVIGDTSGLVERIEVLLSSLEDIA